MLTTEKHIYVACNLAEIAEREDGYYTANNGTEVSFSVRNDDDSVSIEDLEELQEAIMVFLQLRHEKSKQRAEEIPPGEWSTKEETHLPPESTGDSKPNPPSAITWEGTWEEFEDARLKYAEAEDYRTQQEAANSQESSL